MKWFIFITLLIAQYSQAFLFGNSEIRKQKAVCSTLYSDLLKPNPDLYQASKGFEDGSTEAKLFSVFYRLPEDQLSDLLSRLTPDMLEKLAHEASMIRLDRPVSKRIHETPGLKNLILDLRNVLSKNRDLITEEGVNVRELMQRLAQHKVKILPSSTEGASLVEATNRLGDTVVARALSEYRGDHKGGLISRLKRFTFPLHKRVERIVEFNQLNRNELHFIDDIDQIVADQIANARANGMNTDEVNHLRQFIDDTPGQIIFVNERFKQVYGTNVHTSDSINIDSIDIYDLYSLASKQNSPQLAVDFHRDGERALDVMEKTINDARARKGLKPRHPTEYGDPELRIRYMERNRKIRETRDLYRSWTDQQANVRYTVERRRTRVVSYTGADGKTKTRTETYYETETVRPSYENILLNQFDRGDRFVSGLDEIVHSTRELRKNEGVFREKMNQLEERLSSLVEEKNLFTLKTDYPLREQTVKELHLLRQELIELRKTLIAHQKKSNEAIWTQWKSDDPENFRSRNLAMISRFNNMARHYENVAAQVDRKMDQLALAYPQPDRAAEMDYLYKKRVQAGVVKGVGVTATTGGTGYLIYEGEDGPVHSFLRDMTETVLNSFR